MRVSYLDSFVLFCASAMLADILLVVLSASKWSFDTIRFDALVGAGAIGIAVTLAAALKG